MVGSSFINEKGVCNQGHSFLQRQTKILGVNENGKTQLTTKQQAMEAVNVIEASQLETVSTTTVP